MNKLIKYLITKKLLIVFSIFTFLFIITSYALSVWFSSFSNLIQIILYILFVVLSLFFLISFYLSIKKQKTSYFANASVSLFICIIAGLILYSHLGVIITNQLLGNPTTTAVYRNARLNLRDNKNFDICYEASFVKMREIFSGTYSIKNNEILFYYNSNIPQGCSKIAKFEEENRVIRFYDVDGKHLLPFYIY